MRIYFGQVGWGWKMYGIGYKTKWFLGFSMQYGPKQLDAEIDKILGAKNDSVQS